MALSRARKKPRASHARRYSRHDVAFLYVIADGYATATTRRVPAGILRRRATVALTCPA